MTSRNQGPEATPGNTIPSQCAYVLNSTPPVKFHSAERDVLFTGFDSGKVLTEQEYNEMVATRDLEPVLINTLCFGCGKLGHGCCPELLFPQINESNNCRPLVVMPQEVGPEKWAGFMPIDESFLDCKGIEAGEETPNYCTPNAVPVDCGYVLEGQRPEFNYKFKNRQLQFPKIIFDTMLRVSRKKIENLMAGDTDFSFEGLVHSLTAKTLCGACPLHNLQDCLPSMRFSFDEKIDPENFRVGIEPWTVHGDYAFLKPAKNILPKGDSGNRQII